jgi:HEPN domain-containing protein
MNDRQVTAYVNTFVSRSFRDVADQDYILARAAFRNDLDLQFIWLSHQAIEKYLKAILVFNRRSAKGFNHDLSAAYRAVLAIDDVPFDFPECVPTFIEYVERHASRYFEFPYYVFGEHLLHLDETIWHLRRWCEYLRGNAQVGEGPQDTVENLPFEIERRRFERWSSQPHKFRVFGGFLEDVLDKRRHGQLRSILVWNNTFFSRRRKVSYHLGRTSAANTLLSMHPDVFEHLEPLIHFSKELKESVKRWRS